MKRHSYYLRWKKMMNKVLLNLIFQCAHNQNFTFFWFQWSKWMLFFVNFDVCYFVRCFQIRKSRLTFFVEFFDFYSIESVSFISTMLCMNISFKWFLWFAIFVMHSCSSFITFQGNWWNEWMLRVIYYIQIYWKI